MMPYARLNVTFFICCWIGVHSTMVSQSLHADETLAAPSTDGTARVADDAAPPTGRNVVLVTLDGMRWQDVFHGADERLISPDAGAKNIEETQQRFLAGGPTAAREKLMPFLWSTVANEGVLYGDPEQESAVRVTNAEHFSYPGYSELLCGFADPKINSNAKTYNENTTVLEWLSGKPEFKNRVAAFCSWDVFPYIINDRRSGILVNAGWAPVADIIPEGEGEELKYREQLQQLDMLAAEIPHLWEGVRYDYFTFRAAQIYLQSQHPRVLYVSLGETDDWAHQGRYDLYLDAAQRNDDYIRRLWETIQSIEGYRDNTTLIITSDHGRGDNRSDWKSHSSSIAGCDMIWAAAMGPRIHSGPAARLELTQSQIAATVAAALGYDFTQSKPGIATPFPCVLGVTEVE